MTIKKYRQLQKKNYAFGEKKWLEPQKITKLKKEKQFKGRNKPKITGRGNWGQFGQYV